MTALISSLAGLLSKSYRELPIKGLLHGQLSRTLVSSVKGPMISQ